MNVSKRMIVLDLLMTIIHFGGNTEIEFDPGTILVLFTVYQDYYVLGVGTVLDLFTDNKF